MAIYEGYMCICTIILYFIYLLHHFKCIPLIVVLVYTMGKVKGIVC